MKRELILGYDPDHYGDDVLDCGRVLAEVLASKALVVTALPWPQLMVGLRGVEDKLADDMEEHFVDVRRQLAGLDVETRVIACGSPSSALAEVAREEDAMLLVIGSAHHGRVGRTLAGSVGESLLHGAPCSVAIAPRGYSGREQGRMQRIAVAFDGSPESWTALETAIGLTERSHALLSVLTVADYPRFGYASAWTLMVTGELQDAEEKEKERLLNLAISRIPAKFESESRVLTGEVARELERVSGEFDLMITGSRSWGPLRRTMLGSTTRKLIRSAACPILVVPRGVGMDPLGVRDPRVAAATSAPVHWC
jgi:nucleotide-binding universal stress UspA family protein